MRNLIVNADDFGWTPGINRGIAEAHRHGIVTSATLLANGSAFEEAVRMARELPSLGLGVHLNLSDGVPVLPQAELSGLAGKDGRLCCGPEKLLLRLTTGRVTAAQVEREWDAQIRKVRAAGIEPTHLDGHKHVHMLPGLFPIALKMAKRHGIGAVRVSLESSGLREALAAGDGHSAAVVLKQGIQARGLKLLARNAREQATRAGIAVADYFCGIAQTGEMTEHGVERLLRSLPEGTTELMCHPGYADEDLRGSDTRLQGSREEELRILSGTTVRNCVASLGIRLINYAEIANLV